MGGFAVDYWGWSRQATLMVATSSHLLSRKSNERFGNCEETMFSGSPEDMQTLHLFAHYFLTAHFLPERQTEMPGWEALDTLAKPLWEKRGGFPGHLITDPFGYPAQWTAMMVASGITDPEDLQPGVLISTDELGVAIALWQESDGMQFREVLEMLQS